jgi:hypothetical protein
MLRISGMMVVLVTLWSRREIPDNAAHFRDDGASIWVFDTVIPTKEYHPRAGTSSPQGTSSPRRRGSPRISGMMVPLS